MPTNWQLEKVINTMDQAKCSSSVSATPQSPALAKKQQHQAFKHQASTTTSYKPN